MTDDRQTTHWEGCHTKHLDCAQARIAELEARCKPWLDAIDDHAADGVTVEQVIDKERDTLRALIQEYKNTEAGLRHLLMRAWLAVEKEAYAEGETWEEVSCDVYWSGVGSHEAEAAAKTITNLQSRIAELERSNVTLAEHVDRLHTLNAELEADKARLRSRIIELGEAWKCGFTQRAILLLEDVYEGTKADMAIDADE